MKKFITKPTNKKKIEAENAKAEADLLEKWQKVPSFSRLKVHPKPDTKLKFDASTPPGRETPKLPSKVTSGASTAQKESPQYTGGNIIGLGQMHKSNAVPIFNKEAAIDVAKMRRN